MLLLGDIDFNKKPEKSKLFLAKPNREIIGKLNEAFNVNNKTLMGRINELNFSLPYEIDKGHAQIRNPHVDQARDRYLIKRVKGAVEEWFMILKPKDEMGTDEDVKSFQAFSLGYELKDKLIREYHVVSYTASQVLLEALQDTIWNIGSVDALFDTMYREFNVTSKTVLDFIFEIADTFGALVEFDTVNRRINLKQQTSVGQDKGFKFSYGKYLQTLNKEVNSDDMATQIIPTGKDGLTIHRLNPTGTGYLEDFSYFLFPFRRDENKNVLEHSDFMSDELCHAILDYNILLESKKDIFNNLLTEKKGYEDTLTTKNNELFTLETELAIIRDSLDVAQATGNPTAQILTDEANKLAQVNTKKAEIVSVNAQITDVDNRTTTLRNEISIENNFTPSLITERNQFIITTEWSDQNYVDDEDLYNASLKKLDEIKSPKLVVNIDIVDFRNILTEQKNWNKISMGDTVTIFHEKFNINAKARIIEVNENEENEQINLTIANTKDIESDEDKLTKMLYGSTSTSTTVDMNRYKWDKVHQNTNDIDVILNNVWESALRAINAGVSESVTIDRRGITITDPSDIDRFLRATHGVIGMTKDGGKTFSTAITPEGMIAERLYGRIIMTNRVVIGDDDGIFEIRGNQGIVSDRTGKQVMWMGLIGTDPDKFGLKLENDKNQVIVDRDDGFVITKKNTTTTPATWDKTIWTDPTNGVLHAEGLEVKNIKITDNGNQIVIDAKNGIIDLKRMDGWLGNNIELSTTEGVTVTRGDGTVKTVLNATDGIYIARKEGTDWVKKFYVDIDGVLHAEDLIAKRLILTDGTDQILIDAKNKILDLSKFSLIIGKLQAENIDTKVITADAGYIANLAVNRLKTLGVTSEGVSTNYIDIKDNIASWITGNIKSGSGVQMTNAMGRPLYWTDSNRGSFTTTVTAYPAMKYDYDERVKMKMYFSGTDASAYPIIQLGEGVGTGKQGQGFMFKDSNSLRIQYFAENTEELRELKMIDSGIYVESVNGGFESKSATFGLFNTAQTSGVQLLADGTIKLYHSSGSYILLGSDVKIVSSGNILLN